ncbi:carbohydrate-binding domain-containing protein [Paenibacillus soyae]|uniref:Carbohydrate-binding domain-containing protein n=1 Tax=Paenibacillus soyae TaxID=2969249 RepID=A0A9X2MUU4_9BACL|nr:carbohydrate-binding domain-containing protein [Paenibacillus soyae]MCR2806970.1 carbohydrate-binding domain-containing protein [Paenibacillus soyae]
MKTTKMKHFAGVVALCTVLLASACSNGGNNTAATSNAAVVETVSADQQTDAATTALTMDELVEFDEEDYSTEWSEDSATKIVFDGASATVTGAGAAAGDGGSVSITEAGTYVLSGSLSDGQLTVNAPDGTVRLVLNGVELHHNDNAPLYILEAGKVVMTLQEGTDNKLSDGAEYSYADANADEPNAALYSKADLTINGTGSLTVEGNFNNGINSRDDLKLVSGTITVKAVDDGLLGKDRVAALEGTALTVEAGGDGVKSTNAEEEGKGIIAIGGGVFDITSGNDALQAETSMLVAGGTFSLVTGGGSVNGETHTEEFGGGWGGGGQGFPGGGEMPAAPGTGDAAGAASEASAASASDAGVTTAAASTTDAAATTAEAAEEESTSAKALKAGSDIQIGGGTFTIDSADDSVHSNGNLTIAGGEFSLTSGDDGIHADSAVTIAGGKIDITKSYEGIEGSVIKLAGGETNVTASDDGVNVGGGNDGSSVNGRAGQNTITDGTHMLTISGGTHSVNASGDGLDSNGSIAMSGGTVTVSGPTNAGNGSLDYDGTFEMTGGYLIAAGSSGMLQATSDTSSQQSVLMMFPSTLEAGTLVRLEDDEGNAIATFAPAKTFQAVMISSPDLKQGGTYKVFSGGSSTGTETNGLYEGGEYTGGTEVVSFEITSAVTWVNESGVTTAQSGMGMGGGGRGGMGGGQRPMRGQGGQLPADGTAPGAGDGTVPVAPPEGAADTGAEAQ